MSEISRDEWVEWFKTGFKRGASERKKQPENRYDELSDNPKAESDAELDALNAGFELGEKKAYPGADIDVEQKANTAYDRSDHSKGLSHWG